MSNMRKNISYLVLCLSFFIAAYPVASGQSAVVISDLERIAYENVYELIAGKVSGVSVSGTDGNPLSMPSVTVRGVSSLRSSGRPLFVVDGVVIDDAVNCSQDAFWQYGEKSYTSVLDPLAFLSVYDVEKIEVLKDRSATSLYGSRGAGGVILITTRGNVKKPFRADWNTDVSVTPGLSHSHSVALGGAYNNLDFNASAFFRGIDRDIANLGSRYGGGRMALRSSGNAPVRFGLNSTFVVGNASSPAGTAYFGAPSQTLAMRDETAFYTDLEGWQADYDDDNKEIRSLNSAFLEVDLGRLVTWTTRAGMDFRKSTRIFWYGNGTLFGKENNGTAAETSSSVFSYNASTSFDYGQFIAGRHHVRAMLKADLSGYINSYNVLNGINFFTHELRGNGLSLMQCEKKPRSFDTDYRNFGGILSAGYEYDGIAGLDAGLRAEMTPEYYGGVRMYPYASAHLNLHKAFIPDRKGVSTLRLKGGYGINGSEKAMPYELAGTFVTGVYPAVENGSEPYHKGFASLVSKGWHITAEAGFADDRIMISASFYDDSVTDSYSILSFGTKEDAYWKPSSRELVHSFGSSYVRHGIEVDLNAAFVRNRNFSWNLFANLSHEANMVTEVAGEDVYGRQVGSGLKAGMNIIGQPLGTITGFVEDAEGKLKDINRDTRLTQADKVILGNHLPDLYGALGMNFSFYGVSVEMLLRGTMGHQIVNLNALAVSGKKDVTSAYVENGDWLRLSRFSVGYDIPLRLKWLDRLNVNVSAVDMLTLTSYSGWNPDVSSYGPGVASGGYDYGSLPMAKRVVIGICAKF